MAEVRHSHKVRMRSKLPDLFKKRSTNLLTTERLSGAKHHMVIVMRRWVYL